ncbi:MAG: sugar phosphate isomerase/epimerase [Rhodospirillales bacterium]|nr:sugar phosphate isomerase/epimerase [Rhodospirillales bacterium]
MTGARFSCTTATFGGTLADRLAAIRTAGFAATELWPRDVFEGFADAETSLRLLRESGLAVSCYQGLRDFEAMPAGARDRKLALATQLMDQMTLFGADLLVLCSNTSPDATRDWHQAVDDLRRLGDLARRRNLRIGYEPLCYSSWIADYREGWRLVREVDHDRIGLVLDSAHIFLLDLPLEPISEIPGERIFLAEFADLPGTRLPIREVLRFHRLFPGEGVRPMEEYARRVASTGYTGYYSVEIFSSHYGLVEPTAVAARAFASMAHLFESVRQS